MAAVPRRMSSLAQPLVVCRRCIIQQQGLNPWGAGLQRQRRNKHQESKYEKKVKVAAEQWAQKAEEIAAGTRRNVWDILEERGFVKDTAGYAFVFAFSFVR
jgi:tyrosyl-tRNA synthetase